MFGPNKLNPQFKLQHSVEMWWFDMKLF
jgi:hypothetical protein